MKRHLKIISLLSLFVIASTTCFIFAKRPADDKPETVMVTVDKPYIASKYEISIIYNSNKIENLSVDLEKLDQTTIGIIQKLNLEGYKVQSQSSYPISYRLGYNDIGETWVLTSK